MWLRRDGLPQFARDGPRRAERLLALRRILERVVQRSDSADRDRELNGPAGINSVLVKHVGQSGRDRNTNHQQHHLKSSLSELIGMFAVQ